MSAFRVATQIIWQHGYNVKKRHPHIPPLNSVGNLSLPLLKSRHYYIQNKNNNSNSNNIFTRIMIQRSMSSTAAVTVDNNETSRKTTTSMVLLDSMVENHRNNDGTIPSKTTTSTTTTVTQSKTCPLRRTESSYHTPISLNYHRSKRVLQQLIQQRVWERNTYMNTNSIATQELSSIYSSLSSFMTSLSDIVQMGAKFRIPTPLELDAEFPIRPIHWEQIKGYNNNVTQQQKPHPPVTSNPTTTTTTITTNSTTTDHPTKMQVTWLGHSSLLIQYPNGINVLTDPVFSRYCSPFPQSLGPQRYRSTPCTLSELLHHLTIDIVLISHNHYDHLDFPTIQQLYQQNPTKTQFVVPLGLQQWLRNYIDPHIRTYELDWYEYMTYPTTKRKATKETNTCSTTTNKEATIQIQSIPMKHWSSRYGLDRDHTLWCGYSLEYIPAPTTGQNNDTITSSTNVKPRIDTERHENGRPSKFLFSGDTAYYDAMKECIIVPEHHRVTTTSSSSPITSSSVPTDSSTSATGSSQYHYDVAAIPIGAYEPRPFMYHNHMNVVEAIRMKDDISCQHAIPIHWGTFPLTFESVMEPRNQLLQYMGKRNDAATFVPWSIGETKQY